MTTTEFIAMRRNFHAVLQAQREALLDAAAKREAGWADGRGDQLHRANLEIVRRLRAAADLLVSEPFNQDEELEVTSPGPVDCAKVKALTSNYCS